MGGKLWRALAGLKKLSVFTELEYKWGSQMHFSAFGGL
jgi:hypothetical protein